MQAPSPRPMQSRWACVGNPTQAPRPRRWQSHSGCASVPQPMPGRSRWQTLSGLGGDVGSSLHCPPFLLLGLCSKSQAMAEPLWLRVRPGHAKRSQQQLLAVHSRW